MPDVLAAIGIAALAFCALLWINPYACKETAAALLSHAEATEESRKIRKRASARFRKRFGLPDRTEATASASSLQGAVKSAVSIKLGAKSAKSKRGEV